MEFTTRLVCKCFLLILNGKASHDLLAGYFTNTHEHLSFLECLT